MSSNRRFSPWVACLIVGICLAAYLNSLSGPFLLDDPMAVANNPSIRSLARLDRIFSPPAESTVAGRPVANLSFALNYAMGGLDVRSYHAANLLLHAGSALLLFGILRRTFSRGSPHNDRPGFPRWVEDQATVLATGIAALWAAHPLQTASVSYISQRTELLMAFFYLMALYAFVRSRDAAPVAWRSVSVVACWLGMMCKESMVTAPVLILLYDTLFSAGQLTRALRERWRYYAALAASWILLAALMMDVRQRAVGFGLGVSSWQYLLTEGEAIVTYLVRIVWPHPLIFDYGALFYDGSVRAVACVVVSSGLLAVAGVLFWKRSRLGFAAIAFFLILAPTSSIVPVSAQPIAENRAYLASAPILVLVGLAVASIVGRRASLLALAVVVALVAVTVGRNRLYGDRLALWTDTIAQRPMNPRAHANLGELHFEAGRLGEARALFERALALQPNYPETLNNLGATLYRLGEPARALEVLKEAVRLKPGSVPSRNNLGNGFLQAGRLPEAEAEFRTAMALASEPGRLVPELPDIHNSLGIVLLYQGRTAEAQANFEAALRLRPDFLQARMNLGVALRILGKLEDAKRQFVTALDAQPNYPDAEYNLGITLAQLGEGAEARRHLEKALQLRGNFPAAHQALGDLAVREGRKAEAHAHFEQALKANPNDAQLRERWQATAPAGAPP